MILNVLARVHFTVYLRCVVECARIAKQFYLPFPVAYIVAYALHTIYVTCKVNFLILRFFPFFHSSTTTTTTNNKTSFMLRFSSILYGFMYVEFAKPHTRTCIANGRLKYFHETSIKYFVVFKCFLQDSNCVWVCVDEPYALLYAVSADIS